MISKTSHHRLQFFDELLMVICRPFILYRIWSKFAPKWPSASARHILPNHHPNSITMSIVTPRLNLDVLSDHVETGLLQILDVKTHRCITGGRQQAVRPPTLIQSAVMEHHFAIQGHANLATRAANSSYLTHGCIRLNAIDQFFTIEQLHGDVIETRASR